MDELTFPAIEDDVTGVNGDVTYEEILRNAASSVSAHIDHYWVPTIPLSNREAVSAIVADILVEQTIWCTQRPGTTADEILDHATNSVHAHLIEDYGWVRTIPRTESNRAAVSAIVARVLIEHAHWFASRESEDD